jgi:hypothetical protein
MEEFDLFWGLEPEAQRDESKARESKTRESKTRESKTREPQTTPAIFTPLPVTTYTPTVIDPIPKSTKYGSVARLQRFTRKDIDILCSEQKWYTDQIICTAFASLNQQTEERDLLYRFHDPTLMQRIIGDQAVRILKDQTNNKSSVDLTPEDLTPEKELFVDSTYFLWKQERRENDGSEPVLYKSLEEVLTAWQSLPRKPAVTKEKKWQQMAKKTLAYRGDKALHVNATYDFFPCNVTRNHWILLIINTQTKTLSIYDPMGQALRYTVIAEALLNSVYIKYLHPNTLRFEVKVSSWSTQQDTFQCGPYVILYAVAWVLFDETLISMYTVGSNIRQILSHYLRTYVQHSEQNTSLLTEIKTSGVYRDALDEPPLDPLEEWWNM